MPAPAKPSPIAINLYDGTRAEITVRGTIGVSWRSTADEVDFQLPATVTHAKVRINSLGGLLHEAIAIHNILRAHPAQVEVIIEGVAGSAASVVAMAGDEIVMYPSALMMIHAVKMVEEDDWGTEVETPEAQAAARAFNTALTTIYAAQTGKTADEIAQLIATDAWMTAAEAVEAGFADRIEAFTPDAAAPAAEPINAGLLAIACAAGIPHEVLTRAATAHNHASEGGDPSAATPRAEGQGAAAAAAPEATPEAAAEGGPEGAPEATPEAAAINATAFADQVKAMAIAAGLGDYVAEFVLDDSINNTAQATAAIARAREVRSLCLAVNAADMLPGLIRTRATRDDARQAIATARAKADDALGIRNHQPSPGPGLNTAETPATAMARIYANLNRFRT